MASSAEKPCLKCFGVGIQARVTCISCEDYICSHCHWCEACADHQIRKCGSCGETSCDQCVEAEFCERCEVNYCNECREVVTCTGEGCGKNLCLGYSDGGEYAPSCAVVCCNDDCGSPLCTACATGCALCHGAICSNCNTACPGCDLKFCDGCGCFAEDCDTGGCDGWSCLLCVANNVQCADCLETPSRALRKSAKRKLIVSALVSALQIRSWMLLHCIACCHMSSHLYAVLDRCAHSCLASL
jgi:hypothetical protein